jgi:hypothetical protein
LQSKLDGVAYAPDPKNLSAQSDHQSLSSPSDHQSLSSPSALIGDPLIDYEYIPQALQAFAWGDKWRDRSNELPGFVSDSSVFMNLGITLISSGLMPGGFDPMNFAFSLSLSSFTQTIATICVQNGTCSASGAFILTQALSMGITMAFPQTPTAALTSGAAAGISKSVSTVMDKVKGFFEGIWDSIKEVFGGTASNTVVGAAATTTPSLGGIAGAIANPSQLVGSIIPKTLNAYQKFAVGFVAGAVTGWVKLKIVNVINKKMCGDKECTGSKAIIKDAMTIIATSLATNMVLQVGTAAFDQSTGNEYQVGKLFGFGSSETATKESQKIGEARAIAAETEYVTKKVDAELRKQIDAKLITYDQALKMRPWLLDSQEGLSLDEINKIKGIISTADFTKVTDWQPDTVSQAFQKALTSELPGIAGQLGMMAARLLALNMFGAKTDSLASQSLGQFMNYVSTTAMQQWLNGGSVSNMFAQKKGDFFSSDIGKAITTGAQQALFSMLFGVLEKAAIGKEENSYNYREKRSRFRTLMFLASSLAVAGLQTYLVNGATVTVDGVEIKIKGGNGNMFKNILLGASPDSKYQGENERGIIVSGIEMLWGTPYTDIYRNTGNWGSGKNFLAYQDNFANLSGINVEWVMQAKQIEKQLKAQAAAEGREYNRAEFVIAMWQQRMFNPNLLSVDHISSTFANPIYSNLQRLFVELPASYSENIKFNEASQDLAKAAAKKNALIQSINDAMIDPEDPLFELIKTIDGVDAAKQKLTSVTKGLFAHIESMSQWGLKYRGISHVYSDPIVEADGKIYIYGSNTVSTGQCVDGTCTLTGFRDKDYMSLTAVKGLNGRPFVFTNFFFDSEINRFSPLGLNGARLNTLDAQGNPVFTSEANKEIIGATNVRLAGSAVGTSFQDMLGLADQQIIDRQMVNGSIITNEFSTGLLGHWNNRQNIFNTKDGSSVYGGKWDQNDPEKRRTGATQVAFFDGSKTALIQSDLNETDGRMMRAWNSETGKFSTSAFLDVKMDGLSAATVVKIKELQQKLNNKEIDRTVFEQGLAAIYSADSMTFIKSATANNDVKEQTIDFKAGFGEKGPQLFSFTGAIKDTLKDGELGLLVDGDYKPRSIVSSMVLRSSLSDSDPITVATLNTTLSKNQTVDFLSPDIQQARFGEILGVNVNPVTRNILAGAVMRSTDGVERFTNASSKETSVVGKQLAQATEENAGDKGTYATIKQVTDRTTSLAKINSGKAFVDDQGNWHFAYAATGTFVNMNQGRPELFIAEEGKSLGVAGVNGEQRLVINDGSVYTNRGVFRYLSDEGRDLALSPLSRRNNGAIALARNQYIVLGQKDEKGNAVNGRFTLNGDDVPTADFISSALLKGSNPTIRVEAGFDKESIYEKKYNSGKVAKITTEGIVTEDLLLRKEGDILPAGSAINGFDTILGNVKYYGGSASYDGKTVALKTNNTYGINEQGKFVVRNGQSVIGSTWQLANEDETFVLPWSGIKEQKGTEGKKEELVKPNERATLVANLVSAPGAIEGDTLVGIGKIIDPIRAFDYRDSKDGKMLFAANGTDLKQGIIGVTDDWSKGTYSLSPDTHYMRILSQNDVTRADGSVLKAEAGKGPFGIDIIDGKWFVDHGTLTEVQNNINQKTPNGWIAGDTVTTVRYLNYKPSLVISKYFNIRAKDGSRYYDTSQNNFTVATNGDEHSFMFMEDNGDVFIPTWLKVTANGTRKTMHSGSKDALSVKLNGFRKASNGLLSNSWVLGDGSEADKNVMNKKPGDEKSTKLAASGITIDQNLEANPADKNNPLKTKTNPLIVQEYKLANPIITANNVNLLGIRGGAGDEAIYSTVSIKNLKNARKPKNINDVEESGVFDVATAVLNSKSTTSKLFFKIGSGALTHDLSQTKAFSVSSAVTDTNPLNSQRESFVKDEQKGVNSTTKLNLDLARKPTDLDTLVMAIDMPLYATATGSKFIGGKLQLVGTESLMGKVNDYTIDGQSLIRSADGKAWTAMNIIEPIKINSNGKFGAVIDTNFGIYPTSNDAFNVESGAILTSTGEKITAGVGTGINGEFLSKAVGIGFSSTDSDWKVAGKTDNRGRAWGLSMVGDIVVPTTNTLDPRAPVTLPNKYQAPVETQQMSDAISKTGYDKSKIYAALQAKGYNARDINSLELFENKNGTLTAVITTKKALAVGIGVDLDIRTTEAKIEQPNKGIRAFTVTPDFMQISANGMVDSKGKKNEMLLELNQTDGSFTSTAGTATKIDFDGAMYTYTQKAEEPGQVNHFNYKMTEKDGKVGMGLYSVMTTNEDGDLYNNDVNNIRSGEGIKLVRGRDSSGKAILAAVTKNDYFLQRYFKGDVSLDDDAFRSQANQTFDLLTGKKIIAPMKIWSGEGNEISTWSVSAHDIYKDKTSLTQYITDGYQGEGKQTIFKDRARHYLGTSDRFGDAIDFTNMSGLGAANAALTVVGGVGLLSKGATAAATATRSATTALEAGSIGARVGDVTANALTYIGNAGTKIVPLTTVGEAALSGNAYGLAIGGAVGGLNKVANSDTSIEDVVLSAIDGAKIGGVMAGGLGLAAKGVAAADTAMASTLTSSNKFVTFLTKPTTLTVAGSTFGGAAINIGRGAVSSDKSFGDYFTSSQVWKDARVGAGLGLLYGLLKTKANIFNTSALANGAGYGAISVAGGLIDKGKNYNLSQAGFDFTIGTIAGRYLINGASAWSGTNLLPQTAAKIGTQETAITTAVKANTFMAKATQAAAAHPMVAGSAVGATLGAATWARSDRSESFIKYVAGGAALGAVAGSGVLKFAFTRPVNPITKAPAQLTNSSIGARVAMGSGLGGAAGFALSFADPNASGMDRLNHVIYGAAAGASLSGLGLMRNGMQNFAQTGRINGVIKSEATMLQRIAQNPQIVPRLSAIGAVDFGLMMPAWGIIDAPIRVLAQGGNLEKTYKEHFAINPANGENITSKDLMKKFAGDMAGGMKMGQTIGVLLPLGQMPLKSFTEGAFRSEAKIYEFIATKGHALPVTILQLDVTENIAHNLLQNKTDLQKRLKDEGRNIARLNGYTNVLDIEYSANAYASQKTQEQAQTIAFYSLLLKPAGATQAQTIMAKARQSMSQGKFGEAQQGINRAMQLSGRNDAQAEHLNYTNALARANQIEVDAQKQTKTQVKEKAKIEAQELRDNAYQTLMSKIDDIVVRNNGEVKADALVLAGLAEGAKAADLAQRGYAKEEGTITQKDKTTGNLQLAYSSNKTEALQVAEAYKAQDQQFTAAMDAYAGKLPVALKSLNAGYSAVKEARQAIDIQRKINAITSASFNQDYKEMIRLSEELSNIPDQKVNGNILLAKARLAQSEEYSKKDTSAEIAKDVKTLQNQAKEALGIASVELGKSKTVNTLENVTSRAEILAYQARIETVQNGNSSEAGNTFLREVTKKNPKDAAGYIAQIKVLSNTSANGGEVGVRQRIDDVVNIAKQNGVNHIDIISSLASRETSTYYERSITAIYRRENKNSDDTRKVVELATEGLQRNGSNSALLIMRADANLELAQGKETKEVRQDLDAVRRILDSTPAFENRAQDVILNTMEGEIALRKGAETVPAEAGALYEKAYEYFDRAVSRADADVTAGQLYNKALAQHLAIKSGVEIKATEDVATILESALAKNDKTANLKIWNLKEDLGLTVKVVGAKDNSTKTLTDEQRREYAARVVDVAKQSEATDVRLVKDKSGNVVSVIRFYKNADAAQLLGKDGSFAVLQRADGIKEIIIIAKDTKAALHEISEIRSNRQIELVDAGKLEGLSKDTAALLGLRDSAGKLTSEKSGHDVAVDLYGATGSKGAVEARGPPKELPIDINVLNVGASDNALVATIAADTQVALARESPERITPQTKELIGNYTSPLSRQDQNVDNITRQLAFAHLESRDAVEQTRDWHMSSFGVNEGIVAKTTSKIQDTLKNQNRTAERREQNIQEAVVREDATFNALKSGSNEGFDVSNTVTTAIEKYVELKKERKEAVDPKAIRDFSRALTKMLNDKPSGSMTKGEIMHQIIGDWNKKITQDGGTLSFNEGQVAVINRMIDFSLSKEPQGSGIMATILNMGGGKTAITERLLPIIKTQTKNPVVLITHDNLAEKYKGRTGYQVLDIKNVGDEIKVNDHDIVVMSYTQAKQIDLERQLNANGTVRVNPFKDAVIFADEAHLFFTSPALVIGGTADAGIRKVQEWRAQGKEGNARIEFEKGKAEALVRIMGSIDRYLKVNGVERNTPNKTDGEKVISDAYELPTALKDALKVEYAAEITKYFDKGEFNEKQESLTRYLDAAALFHRGLNDGTIRYEVKDEGKALDYDIYEIAGNGQAAKDRVFSDKEGINALSKVIVAHFANAKATGTDLAKGYLKIIGENGKLNEAGLNMWARHADAKDSMKSTGAQVLEWARESGARTIMLTGSPGESATAMKLMGTEFHQLHAAPEFKDFNYKATVLEDSYEQAFDRYAKEYKDSKRDDLVLVLNTSMLTSLADRISENNVKAIFEKRGFSPESILILKPEDATNGVEGLNKKLTDKIGKITIQEGAISEYMSSHNVSHDRAVKELATTQARQRIGKMIIVTSITEGVNPTFGRKVDLDVTVSNEKGLTKENVNVDDLVKVDHKIFGARAESSTLQAMGRFGAYVETSSFQKGNKRTNAELTELVFLINADPHLNDAQKANLRKIEASALTPEAKAIELRQEFEKIAIERSNDLTVRGGMDVVQQAFVNEAFRRSEQENLKRAKEHNVSNQTEAHKQNVDGQAVLVERNQWLRQMSDGTARIVTEDPNATVYRSNERYVVVGNTPITFNSNQETFDHQVTLQNQVWDKQSGKVYSMDEWNKGDGNRDFAKIVVEMDVVRSAADRGFASDAAATEKRMVMMDVKAEGDRYTGTYTTKIIDTSDNTPKKIRTHSDL